MNIANFKLSIASHLIALASTLERGSHKAIALKRAAKAIADDNKITAIDQFTVSNLKSIKNIGDYISGVIINFVETSHEILNEDDIIINISPELNGLRSKMLLNKLYNDKQLYNAIRKDDSLADTLKMTDEQLKFIGLYKAFKVYHKMNEIVSFMNTFCIDNRLDNFLTICGSLRRHKHIIRDFDILFGGSYSELNKLLFVTRSMIIKRDLGTIDIIGHGKFRVRVRYTDPHTGNSIDGDIRVIEPDSYGTGLLYLTGSKEFNIKLRTTAKRKGYILNEYGLINISDKSVFKCRTEYEVFKLLQLEYVDPQDR